MGIVFNTCSRGDDRMTKTIEDNEVVAEVKRNPMLGYIAAASTGAIAAVTGMQTLNSDVKNMGANVNQLTVEVRAVNATVQNLSVEQALQQLRLSHLEKQLTGEQKSVADRKDRR